MKAAYETPTITDRDVFGPGLSKFALPAVVVGLLALVAAYFTSGAPARFFFSYHVNFCYFASLALGCFFFVFIQHLTSAGWSVIVRRFAEIGMWPLVILAVLFIPVALGARQIFPWMDPARVAADELMAKKHAYLNPTFFYVRCAIYFLIWGGLAAFFLGRSVKQDASGDPRITLALKRTAGPVAVIFALSLTFFAFDMLMSLDPDWFSTIFGVYYFAGSTLSGFAVIALFAYASQRRGYLRNAIQPDHYQDLGKFMFAFTVFWTYIAFSQFMLIWYSNIPEETEWMLKRLTGEWRGASLFLLIGHFGIPFTALISRYPKRRPALLSIAALWILFIHWFDLMWIALPELPGGRPGVVPWAPSDVLCFVGIGGLFVGLALLRARGLALVPKRDPRLAESLAFENVGG